ncbi:nitrogen regulatory IIA protein [Chryseobacterium flavum]|uniref:Nitrogen regulatory IIA protein n=1 Tax=Chryseobacterium flavum TaxID=415851 RepID=A0A3D9CV14_9FLAO|nr:nitrogen regulatory IIA protein [Chryseobacterium flavum]REC69457.1 nitrogen regulatory IIA protein [Chryseobacterium flavum]
MKKWRTTISKWFDRLDEQWRDLPVKRQHHYTLLLFAGYAALSLIVIAKVCYDVGESDGKLTIEHIENPLIKQKKSSASPQDSITTILKRKMYER